MRSILPRLVALLLIVQLAAGCHHWSTLSGVTPQEYIAASQPKRVRVTVAVERTTLVSKTVVRPWVSADTLRGLQVERDGRVLRTADSVKVPLSAVRRFEVRKADVGATVALVATGVVVVGSAIALVAFNNALGDGIGFGCAGPC